MPKVVGFYVSPTLQVPNSRATSVSVILQLAGVSQGRFMYPNPFLTIEFTS